MQRRQPCSQQSRIGCCSAALPDGGSQLPANQAQSNKRTAYCSRILAGNPPNSKGPARRPSSLIFHSDSTTSASQNLRETTSSNNIDSSSPPKKNRIRKQKHYSHTQVPRNDAKAQATALLQLDNPLAVVNQEGPALELSENITFGIFITFSTAQNTNSKCSNLPETRQSATYGISTCLSYKIRGFSCSNTKIVLLSNGQELLCLLFEEQTFAKFQNQLWSGVFDFSDFGPHFLTFRLYNTA